MLEDDPTCKTASLYPKKNNSFSHRSPSSKLRDTADDSRLEAFTVHTLTVIDGDDDGDRGIIEMTVMITNGWPPLEILDTDQTKGPPPNKCLVPFWFT